MVITCATVLRQCLGENHEEGDVPPDVEWQLESCDENALIKLPRSVTQRMLAYNVCLAQ